MLFKSVIPVCYLLVSTFAAPLVPEHQIFEHQLTKRNGKQVQKAWADVDFAYRQLDRAFRSVKTNTPGVYGNSTVPATHYFLLDQFRITGATLYGTSILTYAETTALRSTAQSFTATSVTAIQTIMTSRENILVTGERENVHRMLEDQLREYISWSSKINALMPQSQKAGAQSYSNAVINQYITAERLFAA
jgi:hypothetical protein